MTRCGCLVVVATLSSTAWADPVLADCSTTYPRARAEQIVEDPRFKQCGEALLQGYASHVMQQRELVLRLGPVYKRELVAKEDKDNQTLAKEQTKKKSKAFDDAVAQLDAASAPPRVDWAASQPAGAAAKAPARQWLNGIKGASQTLADRINDVGAALKGDERIAFCQQEHLARVSAYLEKKLAPCLRN